MKWAIFLEYASKKEMANEFAGNMAISRGPRLKMTAWLHYGSSLMRCQAGETMTP